jgi:hypothetical protein
VCRPMRSSCSHPRQDSCQSSAKCNPLIAKDKRDIAIEGKCLQMSIAGLEMSGSERTTNGLMTHLKQTEPGLGLPGVGSGLSRGSLE